MSEKRGVIYIGADGRGDVKIGMTKDHKKRIKQFKTANPRFVYLAVFTSETPKATEAEIHTKFEHKRVFGEWFNLNPEDVLWIMNEYVKDSHSLGDIKNIWEAVG